MSLIGHNFQLSQPQFYGMLNAVDLRVIYREDTP